MLQGEDGTEGQDRRRKAEGEEGAHEGPENREREATVDGGAPDDRADEEGTGPEGDEAGAAGRRAEAEEELETELERLRSEVSELNDRHLRLAAEFDNYRRRSRAELDVSRARAQADLVADFLEVLDDLERVRDLDSEATTVDALLEGVEMVERKFVKVLDGAGVEAIDPQGEDFDPEFMEAMATVPADSEDDDDRVHQVFQKGYRLDGHLIRPARVSVLKNA